MTDTDIQTQQDEATPDQVVQDQAVLEQVIQSKIDAIAERLDIATAPVEETPNTPAAKSDGYGLTMLAAILDRLETVEAQVAELKAALLTPTVVTEAVTTPKENP